MFLTYDYFTNLYLFNSTLIFIYPFVFFIKIFILITFIASKSIYDQYKTEETELILFYKGLCPIEGVDLDQLLAKDITIESNDEEFYNTFTNPNLFSVYIYMYIFIYLFI